MNNNVLTQRLNAISNGDEKAFEELYTDLKVPVFTIIYRITWNESMSEDILQEVFFKLFMSPLSPSSIKNPRAYIFQMARNLAIDSTRKQSHDVSLDDISDTVHSSDDFPLRVDIEDALKRIPSQECEIVTLHIIGGFKFREIAEIMKIPQGTAKWKYQEAIKKLKNFLGGSL
jgi:RNA polymerase sigma-70 factor (ECF subfamily)